MPPKVWLIIISLVLVSLVAWKWYNQVPAPSPELKDGAMVTTQLGSKTLTIEIARSPASITQGLSGRTQVGGDGLLFLLYREGIPNFWMKDMLFDLDMIWLQDNTVVDITRNIPHPAPGTPETQLPSYSPKVAANQVLEVPAGTTNAWQISIGDELIYK